MRGDGGDTLEVDIYWITDLRVISCEKSVERLRIFRKSFSGGVKNPKKMNTNNF